MTIEDILRLMAMKQQLGEQNELARLMAQRLYIASAGKVLPAAYMRMGVFGHSEALEHIAESKERTPDDSPDILSEWANGLGKLGHEVPHATVITLEFAKSGECSPEELETYKRCFVALAETIATICKASEMEGGIVNGEG